MKYSFNAIVTSYTEDKRTSDKNNHLILYYLYRPLSFPLTWLFANLRIKANHVTILSILVTLVITYLLILDSLKSKYLAAFLMFIYLVLDCVDGNIARVTKSEAKYGTFIDAFSGLLFWGLVFPFIGIGAKIDIIYFENLFIYLPYISCFIVILFFMGRILNMRVKSISINFKQFTNKKNLTLLLLIKSFYEGIPILYILALLLSVVDLLLLFFLSYFLLALIYIIYNSHQNLSAD